MKTPRKISFALSRVLARREEDRLRKAQKGKRILRWIEHAIGIAAGIAAIFGVWSWVAESGDRDEERRVRQTALVAEAKATINAAASSGVIDTDANPAVAYAIDILADYGQPIQLRADFVYLSELSLRCAEVSIDAKEAEINYSKIGRSLVQWTGSDLKIDGSDFIGSLVTLDAVAPQSRDLLDFKAPRSVTFSGTRWNGGSLHLPIRPYRDALTITMKDAQFRNISINESIVDYRYRWIHAAALVYKADETTCTEVTSGFLILDCPNIGTEPVFDSPLTEPDCNFPRGRLTTAGVRAASRELDRMIERLTDK